MGFLFPLLAVAGSALYHFSLRRTPAGINPFFSLMTSYLIAPAFCLVACALPQTGGQRSFSAIGPWQAPVAIGIFGIETGFILWYRSGWPVGTGAILVNAASTVALAALGVLVLRERFGWP